MAPFPRFREWALAALVVADGAVARAEASDDPRVRASYLLQMDGVLFHQAAVDELDPGSGEPLNEERVIIRRARARVEGQAGFVHGLLQVDANTVHAPTVRLLAAELWLAYPQNGAPLAELGAGLFLYPFGFETSEPAARRLFLEPATWVGALFPGRRDLGVRAAFEHRFAQASIALTNGQPSATAQLPLRDPNRAKDWVGRLGAHGPLAPGVEARVGVSGVLGTGFHPGVRPTKDSLVVRDANEDGIVQTSEIQLVPGQPGEPARNFDRFALGGDVALAFDLPWLGPGRAVGEVVWAQNLDRGPLVADPVAQGRDVREFAFSAAIRQAVTRHAEVGVRFDRYDADRDASERAARRVVPFDATFDTLGAAAAWCTWPSLRVTLEFDHRTNPLGRSASGAPTTLASDSVTLRAQLEM